MVAIATMLFLTNSSRVKKSIDKIIEQRCVAIAALYREINFYPYYRSLFSIASRSYVRISISSISMVVTLSAS